MTLRLDDFGGFGAEFGADRTHRLLLWRVWTPGLPLLGFIMLNPSVADERRDDATTLRNMARAKALGYGGVVQANLYTYRSKSPAALKAAGFPGGRDEAVLERFVKACPDVVVAWGAHARKEDAAWTLNFLAARAKRLFHLGRLKGGEFRHPLHTAYAVPLQPFLVPAAEALR